MSNHVIIGSLMALSAAGCWVSKGEGEAMSTRLASMEKRLATKERDLDDQIAQLKSVIEDATRVLRRNNADIGADLEQLRKDVQQTAGQTTTLNQAMVELRTTLETSRRDVDSRLTAIEGRAPVVTQAPPNLPPEELWKQGSAAYEAGKFPEAAELFRRLVAAAPAHARADDAQYFRAQSLGRQNLRDEAIREYQRLYEKYPTSALADDGLYFAALAAEGLKACGEARTYLGLLKQKYPKSNVAKLADEADARLKAAKGTPRCTS